jgi:hypothetical protein
VHGGDDFDPEEEMTFLRLDFYVTMNMASRSEQGVTSMVTVMVMYRLQGYEGT